MDGRRSLEYSSDGFSLWSWKTSRCFVGNIKAFLKKLLRSLVKLLGVFECMSKERATNNIPYFEKQLIICLLHSS